MNQTIYNQITGQIIAVTNRADAVLPDGHATIPGRFDASTQYVDQQGNIQDLPAQPQDDKKYIFDWSSKTWIEKPLIVTEDTQRQKRNALLTQVDEISATRYASLTLEQQTELQQYRQALLDVPQQAGFPESVTWPTKPAWL